VVADLGETGLFLRQGLGSCYIMMARCRILFGVCQLLVECSGSVKELNHQDL